MDLDYYWKSTANKDENRNNTCHLAYELEIDEGRYKFLNLLI